MAIYSTIQANNNTTLPVLEDEWLLWAGGQNDLALNPEEEFASDDFGFNGDIDWNVGNGTISAIIVSASTSNNTTLIPVNASSVTGKSRIRVRYDNFSPTYNSNDNNENTVKIDATDNSTVATKRRTIFKINQINFNNSTALHVKNPLVYSESVVCNICQDRNTQLKTAGITYPLLSGSPNSATKVEIITEILPTGIEWRKLGVVFAQQVLPETGRPDREVSQSKRISVFRQIVEHSLGFQEIGKPFRLHNNKATINDYAAVWYRFIDYPDDSEGDQTDFIFFIDGPGPYTFNQTQAYQICNFQDFVEFCDGRDWIRISPILKWYSIVTTVLPNAGPGAPFESGLGETNVFLPNNPPTFLVNSPVILTKSVGERVILDYPATDIDNDEITYRWEQTLGNDIINRNLISWTGQTLEFTVPSGSSQLKLKVTATDSTNGLAKAQPGTSSAELEIIINVN